MSETDRQGGRGMKLILTALALLALAGCLGAPVDVWGPLRVENDERGRELYVILYRGGKGRLQWVSNAVPPEPEMAPLPGEKP